MPPKNAAKNLVEITTPMPTSNRQPKAEQALANARAFVIATRENYIHAAEALAFVKSEYKAADADRVELKAPSLDGCRRVEAYFKPTLNFLSEAEKIIKGKLDVYENEQERLRIEEQRKADEAARKEREGKEAEAREIERKAREKAEAERRAAEQKRQEEERARREAEDAKRRGDEAAAAAAREQARIAAAAAAKFDAKAEQIKAKGEEKAAAVQATADSVVAPIIQREPPKVAGLTRREDWHFEIVNAAQVPREYLMVDEVKIGKVVKALKGDTVIAGIRVFPKTVHASGAA